MIERSTKAAWLSAVALVFGLYWTVFDNFFLNDDFGRILALWPLQRESIGHALWAMINHSYHGLYYRPLTNITFYLLAKVAGLNPTWYYVSSIGLHIGASMVAFAVLRRLLEHCVKPYWLAFIGLLIFASHPRHVESVSYIHDNENVLCGLFFFLGLYCFIEYWRGDKKLYLYGAGGCYLLSLLGKEMAITLPVVWGLYALIWPQSNVSKNDGRLKVALVFIVTGLALVLYFSLRLNGLGQWIGGAGETSRLEFDIVRMGRTLVQAFMAMSVPNSFPGLQQATAFFRGYPLLFIVISVGSSALVLWVYPLYKSGLFLFGVLFVAITMLPVLNNGISVELLTGGRYLYISIFGFAVVVVDLLSRIRSKKWSIIACTVLLLDDSFAGEF